MPDDTPTSDRPERGSLLAISLGVTLFFFGLRSVSIVVVALTRIVGFNAAVVATGMAACMVTGIAIDAWRWRRWAASTLPWAIAGAAVIALACGDVMGVVVAFLLSLLSGAATYAAKGKFERVESEESEISAAVFFTAVALFVLAFAAFDLDDLDSGWPRYKKERPVAKPVQPQSPAPVAAPAPSAGERFVEVVGPPPAYSPPSFQPPAPAPPALQDRAGGRGAGNWYCFDDSDIIGRKTGACVPTRAECTTAAKNTGSTRGPCYEQAKAACVSAFYVTFNSTLRYCYPSTRLCNTARRNLRSHTGDVKNVSKCTLEAEWQPLELDKSENWFCYERSSGIGTTSDCRPTLSQCNEARGPEQPDPLGFSMHNRPSECRSQARAACWSAFSVMKDKTIYQCHATVSECRTARSTFRYTAGPDYKKISKCFVAESL